MQMLERILLAGMLPNKATFEIGIVVNDIRHKIAITQDEITRTDLKTLETGGMQWNAGKERTAEIEFTDAELQIIRGALEKASKDGVLPTDPAIHKLYREFVLSETKEPKPPKKTNK